ncbi:MAG: heme-binding domain-containing protein [Desulforhopalus sp.]
MKYKILGILLVTGIAIQFVPYGKDHTNPPVVAEPQWDSQRTEALFTRSCANCHSNNTTWPWYSSIAPVSWLIRYDVDEGREHFNTSRWNGQGVNKGHDAAEELRDGEMPPWIYVLGHPEAKLSESEKGQLVQGLSATFGSGKEK